MAQTYDFPDHVKGDTFEGVVFEVLQNSVAIDLTNYTIKMHLRPSPASNTLSKDVSTSIEKHLPAEGKFRINPVVIDLPARTYYYDIQFTLGTDVSTWIAGEWKVVQDVTDLNRV